MATGAVWKVLDFGVSKLERSGTLTHGNVVGTPGYMAPEQARGGDVGPTADVFALAVIAYRALTGRPAFSGRELPRILFDVCYVQPMQPSKLVPLPDDVERVLLLGMAKDPPIASPPPPSSPPVCARPSKVGSTPPSASAPTP